jgi:hypothetical protein
MRFMPHHILRLLAGIAGSVTFTRESGVVHRAPLPTPWRAPVGRADARRRIARDRVPSREIVDCKVRIAHHSRSLVIPKGPIAAKRDGFGEGVIRKHHPCHKPWPSRCAVRTLHSCILWTLADIPGGFTFTRESEEVIFRW